MYNCSCDLGILCYRNFLLVCMSGSGEYENYQSEGEIGRGDIKESFAFDFGCWSSCCRNYSDGRSYTAEEFNLRTKQLIREAAEEAKCIFPCCRKRGRVIDV